MDLLGAYDEDDGSEAGSPPTDGGGEPGTAEGTAEEGHGDGGRGDLLNGVEHDAPFWTSGGVGGGTDYGHDHAAGPGLATEQLERLRGTGSMASGAPSDVSSPASQRGSDGIDWAKVPQSVAANGSIAGEGRDLPSAPPGPVDEVLRANVESLQAQRKQGKNINADLQDKKEFQNPGILERLVVDFKIMESGTNYGADLFTATFPKELYFDELNKQAARRDALHNATRMSIGFDKGGVQKPDYPRPVIQHVTGASNPQSALAAAAQAAKLAAAHSAGIAAVVSAHPPPAVGTDGPVKKRSKWDSAVPSTNAGVVVLPAGAPNVRPQLLGAPSSVGVGMLPGGARPLLLQQQILAQQQMMLQHQYSSKR